MSGKSPPTAAENDAIYVNGPPSTTAVDGSEEMPEYVVSIILLYFFLCITCHTHEFYFAEDAEKKEKKKICRPLS